MTSNDTAGSGQQRRTFGGLGLLALGVVFLVGVVAINLAFRGLRLDLTENRLYTLSEGTVGVLQSIPEPVNLYLFFSDRATADNPYLRTYAGRVKEMLADFAARSNGQLKLTVVDPVPFSEDEDRATRFGLQPINLAGSPDPVYLGVAGTNSVGDDEIIPFLDPTKEQFLEYDLARVVYTLANPEKPVVALLPGLPMTAGFDPMTQQVRQAWAVADQMRQFFQLRVLDPAITRIEDDVKVLVVAHPKALPPAALYAIDQFVMKGGRALLFVDPFSEIDQGDPMDPTGLGGGRASSLNTLLNAWGVTVDEDHIVGDDRYALTVAMDANRPVRHLGIIGVDAAGLNRDDVISGGLSLVNLGFAGHITALPAGEGKAGATLVPLVSSSDGAALIPAERLSFMPDPELLREGFAPTGENYTLAARLTGPVPSAFPAGPPEGATAPPSGHLAAAAAPINVVVVADTDLLADRLWVQTQDFFGQRLASAFASNGDFVINAVDNLLGSGDLISIRSRATFTRPFTRVQELRRAAEARFRQTEEALQQELEATEARLTQLQANRQDEGAVLLSAEQQAEIDRFTARRLEIRRELREVQRGLQEDIDRLGTVLKVINIGAMPLLISLLSLGLLVVGRRRRRAAAGAARGARS